MEKKEIHLVRTLPAISGIRFDSGGVYRDRSGAAHRLNGVGTGLPGV